MSAKPVIATPISVPPPVHGSNIMNQVVLNLLSGGQDWTVVSMPLQFSTTVENIGKGGTFKILRQLRIVGGVTLKLFRLRPDITYLSPAVAGIGWFRDSLLIAAARLFSREVVVHIHGRGLSKRDSNAFMQWMRRGVFKGTHAIHLSRGLAQSIKHAADWKSLDVLPNGILETSSTASEQIPSTKTPQLLYLSNFVESKGVLDFVAVCKRLTERGLDYQAVIVGGAGPSIDVDGLGKIIEEKGLSKNVSVLGARYGDEKLQVLAEADIFLFPSFYSEECCPLVVLEALSFSIPVVGYDIGAVPEMVEDGESGFIVGSRDLDAMTEKASDLISDIDLLTKMSAAARRRFETEFTMERFESRLHQYFENLIANH